MIPGRAITGFTAGNQPIAQAAMIDGSTDDADRDRNMGYIVTGISFGLVGGPVIGGIRSDRALIGGDASLKLPFYAAIVLVLIAIGLVVLFFKDVRQAREPFVFRPLDVFDSLWRITTRPIVMLSSSRTSRSTSSSTIIRPVRSTMARSAAASRCS